MHYALTRKETPCPVCRSEAAHLLYNVTSEQAAQHFVLREVEPERFARLRQHIEALWKQSECDVVRCDNCEFCYSSPYVAGDMQFYELAYHRKSYPSWKWEHQLTYNALRTSGASRFRILEVGAGDGAFVRRIAPGLTAKENVTCTEFSTFGLDRIRAYGISCVAEDVRELSSKDLYGAFDVVCMFQVLEHMDRLDALFERIAWLAKRNASLFVSVPNPVRIEFTELNGGCLDMPPNHVGRWNRKCFEVLGERFGWSLAQHEIETSEGFISKAKNFSLYRYLLRRQQAPSLANRIEQIRSYRMRRLMQIMGVCLAAVSGLPSWLALRSDELGSSQWVHLKRS